MPRTPKRTKQETFPWRLALQKEWWAPDGYYKCTSRCDNCNRAYASFVKKRTPAKDATKINCPFCECEHMTTRVDQ